MFSKEARAKKQIRRATELFNYLRGKLNSPVSVRLWDGSVVPLGEDVQPGLEISISGPGVIGSLLRRPKADTMLRLYARGEIGFHGADMTSFIEQARVKNSRKKTKGLPVGLLARFASAFIFAKGKQLDLQHCFDGNESGLNREQEDNKDFIQFHYDVSNEFYELFLDNEMVYSCGYFHDRDQSIHQAQINKLDMTCRKLQLQQGERMLDIGCGWGAP